LGFGFVFASAFAKATPDRQSQAAIGHAPSLSLRQNTKIPRCRTATAFSQTLWPRIREFSRIEIRHPINPNSTQPINFLVCGGL
jgi:hypothetical protein